MSMLNMIQNDLPWVAITKSLSSTTISDTWTLGRFMLNGCQSAPSFHDT